MKKYMYFIALMLLSVIIFLEFSQIDKSTTEAFMFQNNKKPIYCVETDDKKIAISFDAAWGADNTKKILDILDSYKVGATFFLVGFWIEKYPDMVKEIEKGLNIANQKGLAIMIGHIWSANTLPNLLMELYPVLVKKGYKFTTVSKSGGLITP